LGPFEQEKLRALAYNPQPNDEYYQVPFEDALPLVRNRQVLVASLKLQVSSDDDDDDEKYQQ
jgi:hypothetical protein